MKGEGYVVLWLVRMHFSSPSDVMSPGLRDTR